MAMKWASRRQWGDAEAALVKVITAMPEDGQAWHQLGLVRYELRDLSGAEAALWQATKKNEKPASSLFMLAVIAASQNRIDTAFKLLDRAAGSDDLNLDRVELRALRSDPRWPKTLGKLKQGR
jgi:Flp pilus assembly protein TadD